MKRLLLGFVLAVAASPAIAGSNSCSGIIKKDSEWLRIDQELNDEPCRIKLGSALGRRVLGKCPVGRECQI